MENLKLFFDKNHIEFYENFDSYKISSIRLGERIKLIVFPHNIAELKKVLKFFSCQKLYFRVFGNLSNILVYESIDYPVIVTNKMETEIERKENFVSVSAGTTIFRLCDFLKKNNLSGIEQLSGIPATIGGAVFSNAGAFGASISDNLVSLEVFCCGKIFEITKNHIKFSYHFSSLSGFIIIKAKFLFENKKEYDIMNMFNEYTFKRNKTQPSGFSLGSVFKRTFDTSAGFFIERSGLKGTKIGGVFVSNKHANFFINDGYGTIADFLTLETIAKNRVLEQFGITLYTEIEKVGNKDETFSRFTYPFKV